MNFRCIGLLTLFFMGPAFGGSSLFRITYGQESQFSAEPKTPLIKIVRRAKPKIGGLEFYEVAAWAQDLPSDYFTDGNEMLRQKPHTKTLTKRGSYRFFELLQSHELYSLLSYFGVWVRFRQSPQEEFYLLAFNQGTAALLELLHSEAAKRSSFIDFRWIPLPDLRGQTLESETELMPFRHLYKGNSLSPEDLAHRLQSSIPFGPILHKPISRDDYPPLLGRMKVSDALELIQDQERPASLIDILNLLPNQSCKNHLRFIGWKTFD